MGPNILLKYHYTYVPFIVSLTTAGLSYKKPAFTGPSCDSSRAQEHDKKDTLDE